MSHNALAMSETATSAAATKHDALDAAVNTVAVKKLEFARLPVHQKVSLLRECIPLLLENAEEWVRGGVAAKGLRPDAPEAGEEWLGGPVVTVRNLRLLADTLEQIDRNGTPVLGKGVTTRPDGRVVIRVMPTDIWDSLIFTGFTGDIWLKPGLTERDARDHQAAFFKQREPKGGLNLVLGAGNVSSIPIMDAVYKMFAEGYVCVIKMNPVNEYLGPVFEKILKPLIDRDYLRIVYGAGDAGAFLSQHPAVDDIHITGSDRTHDLIVWGPPGAERDRRKAANDPVLKKTISSELGNVSPVMIVPARYSAGELKFLARNVTSQIVNNGSFNCNAAKMLVISKGWAQGAELLGLVRECLKSVPPRKAYYPGAPDRYRTLTEGRTVETFGTAAEGQLPWTIVTGLDPAKDELQFTTEPFCSILSVVELPSNDAPEFLAAATTFANEKLWGTLNAEILIPPSAEKDAKTAAALEKAIIDLQYGTVAINHWPGVGYGLVSTPWGGHPSATLQDIQSGLGWVHNTYLIEGIEKCVIRGPFTVAPTPAWFFDNKRTDKIGPPLTRMQAAPSALKMPALLAQAIRG